MQNRDTHVRSLMKGLTWRALATLTTRGHRVDCRRRCCGRARDRGDRGGCQNRHRLVHEPAWEWVPRGDAPALVAEGEAQ